MKHAETMGFLAERIINLFPVERIYLLGQREVTYSTASISINGNYKKESLDQVYLLVVIPDQSTDKKHVIEERIENSCADLVSVTAIVLDVKQLGNWIATGHPFAVEAISDCQLIYRAAPELDFSNCSKALYDYETMFRKGLNRAQEFLIGADLYRIRKQYKMAAFMLHQATEQALLAVLVIKTGLRFNTHNIFRLAQICGMVAPSICEILYEKNVADKKTLSILRCAYIEARYSETFDIDGGSLMILIKRVSIITSSLQLVAV